MRRHLSPIGFVIAIASGLLANATSAQAASLETWVSATGSNAGVCTAAAPCRTFEFAHGQTSPGGSINVLSSGNFGPLTITKSISIVAEGVEAVINSSTGGGPAGAGAAIVVNGSNIVVSLRGVTIDLTNANGINFLSGAALHVHNSVIRRSVVGILFQPASGPSALYAADLVIANSASNGITVNPNGSGRTKVVLDRIGVEKSAINGMSINGLNSTGSITATVRDSVFAGNGGAGISAWESGGGGIKVMIDRTALADGLQGVSAVGAGAIVRIGDSTITGNTKALNTSSGGVIASYGTNKVNGNTNDGAAPTPVAYK